MPSATTHAVTSALALGMASSHLQSKGVDTPHPAVAASAGALLANIPDLLEPAFHPDHRRFFHSVTVAVAIGAGVYQAWHWQPKDDLERLLRFMVLIGGGAYLCHLALDMTTPKSLPLL